MLTSLDRLPQIFLAANFSERTLNTRNQNALENTPDFPAAYKLRMRDELIPCLHEVISLCNKACPRTPKAYAYPDSL